MVFGGRPGTDKDEWDDKTFVYQYDGNDITQNGRFIDTNLEKMESSTKSCRGSDPSAGCVRKNEWPDLPSMPLFGCQEE